MTGDTPYRAVTCMRLQEILSMKNNRLHPGLQMSVAYCAVVFCLLLGCSGCVSLGTGSTDGAGIRDIRILGEDFRTRKGIAYSGYREGMSPGERIYPSEEQILEDLDLLLGEGFSLIRLYDSGVHAQRTLHVIEKNHLDLKVMLGAYLYGSEALYHRENLEQLDGAVSLADTYQDIVLAVSVGNEVLVDWSGVPVPPKDMVKYIRYVRDKVLQPVTVDDNFAPYAILAGYDTKKVWKEIDFAAVHTYAYWDSGYKMWDYRQKEVLESHRAEAMLDAALAYTKLNFQAVRSALDQAGIEIPIVIGETGWQSFPGASINSVQHIGHPVNEAMYYERVMAWAYGEAGDDPGDGFLRPAGICYFEAFDERWKKSDDYWGLWDSDRIEKYVLSGEGYAASDALYYSASEESLTIGEDTFVVFRDEPVGSGEQSTGQSWNAWENGTTALVAIGSDLPAEGSSYAIITPVPASWGWGMTLSVSDAVDLSAFEPEGTLSMQIRTSYSGKLEIGFFTGDAAEGQSVDVYLALDPDSHIYGYDNDGAWHNLRIPVSDITVQAAPAYGMDSSAELNMEEVYSTFVVADRYAVTGNISGQVLPVDVANITWKRER